MAGVQGTTTGAPGGLLGHPGVDDVPSEQVRFAVVLNGGVSLAVWMGGVVLEIDRLTKAPRAGTGAYSILKRLTGCHARADVITGTSAGGINGAALALTQVNRGADPAMLRDLWIDQGRLETLLRQPFRGQPTSLLRGDEYFLPQLNAALSLLAKPHRHWSSERAPIDLTITTTVISGNQAVSVDSMGQRLPQRLHAGRFRWQRPAGVAEDDDPFSEDNLARTAHRLALAARSSASFPVAFEPSFVPVGNPGHREPGPDQDLSDEVRLRPDMGDVVRSWGTGGTARDRSRYCADGGALSNTPTREALEAIERMPATGPVRRVMLLVFPHAPTEADDQPDLRTDPPTMAGSLTGILGALTAQGSRTYVEELERHNLAAAGRRGTRNDLLDELSGPAALARLTRAIHPQYRQLRRWRAGRDLAAWRTGMTSEGYTAAAHLPHGWSFDRVRSAAERAQTEWELTAPAGREPLPYAPLRSPRESRMTPVGWGWGVSAALGISEASADLLRRLVWLLPPGADYQRVEAARQSTFDLARQMRVARDRIDAIWRTDAELVRLVPGASYWTLRLACYDHLMVGSVGRAEIRAAIERVSVDADHADRVEAALAPILDPARATPAYVGVEVRDLVDRVVDTLRPTLAVLAEHADSLAGRDRGLPCWRRVLAPEEDPVLLPRERLVCRLLRLEIASTTLGDEVTTGGSLPVELVQVSAQTRNPFARYTRTGDDKLGGAALNRFGGFLKRSWRVNDWIWGRADGATVLARTMLDPKRIRRTALLSGYLDPAGGGPSPVEMATSTVAGVLDCIGEHDETEALRAAAVEELTGVFDLSVTDAMLPSALPHLADIFAWALHLEAIPGELPALAQAVAADRVDGANPRSRGELFVAENALLLGRLDAAQRTPGGADAADRRRSLDVFDRAGVGWEPMREEAGSDLVIRTATSAAAVMTTVADSDHSGLSAAKPVTRSLRGAMLLPYWALWGLTSRQTVARALALLAFALGGAALALALLGVLSSTLQPAAAALGGGALLAAFAYGALRTGSLLHGIVLLTPVLPLAAYAVTVTEDTQGLSTLLVVAAVALGLMALGTIGVASGSVWAALDGLADRQGFVRPRPPASGRGQAWHRTKVWGRRLGAVLWALLATVAVLLVVGVAAFCIWWLSAPARIEFVQANHRWLWAVAVGLVLLSGAAAHVLGGWHQVLTARATGDHGVRWEYAPVTDNGAVAASWAVVYGAIYLAVAWVISLEMLDEANPLWRRVAFATTLVFAAVLLALPLLLPWRSLAAAAAREVVRGTGATTEVATDAPARHRAFADDLVARGVSLRRFVGHDEQSPVLTTHGGRLDQRIQDARAGAALARAWDAPRELDAGDVERLEAVLPAWRAGPGSLISSRSAQRLADLETLLASPDVRPSQVRYAADRLLASLRRSRGH